MNARCPTDKSTPPRLGCEEAHVVFLVNFLAPNLVAVLQEVAKRVGRLTVLSSVEMEANRQWDFDAEGLEVIVQKTFTHTRTAKHPGGYEEDNYVHFPLDTLRQLRRLRPEVIVSLEMGARTAFSSLYRLLNPRCAHVVAVYASERSEAGRGKIREFTRRRLLRRADWVTYNGPSCRRLLLSLGAEEAKMSPWDYACDPGKVFQGDRVSQSNSMPASADRSSDQPIRMLTVGQLAHRKGVAQALEQLSRWCNENPERRIRWSLLGGGPLDSEMRSTKVPDNLEVCFLGHCHPEVIRQHYGEQQVLLFPTLCDEWGLVVDEALYSGMPVIGSCHSQAVSTLIQEGVNGFVYDPEIPSTLAAVLDRYAALGNDSQCRLGVQARESVQGRTPVASAEQFVAAVSAALGQKGLTEQVSTGLLSTERPDGSARERRHCVPLELTESEVASSGSIKGIS